MKKYFLAVIKYSTGAKKQTHRVLFNAIDYTTAESKVLDYINIVMKLADYDNIDIRSQNIVDVIDGQGDYYYKVKHMIQGDEYSEIGYTIANSDNITSAIKTVENHVNIDTFETVILSAALFNLDETF